jgi:tetratricopeptide (TPR) repeat protein
MRFLHSLIVVVCSLSSLALGKDSPDGLLTQGHADEAIALLNQQPNLGPAGEKDFLLCRAHFDVQDWNKAVSACQKAVSADPGNTRYHLWLGRAYGEKADKSEFLAAASLAKKVHEEFETAIQLDPQNLDARMDLAEFYIEAPAIVGGGKSKAEAQLQAIQALDPVRAYQVKAMLAEKDKNYSAAEQDYRAAVNASHNKGLAWLNLGFFYKRLKQWEAMETALQHAVAAPPDHPEVKMEAAETLVRVDRDIPTAEKWLREYLSSDMVESAPAFKAYYWLGEAKEKEGDTAAAAQSYRTALTLASNYSPAQDALHRLIR